MTSDIEFMPAEGLKGLSTMRLLAYKKTLHTTLDDGRISEVKAVLAGREHVDMNKKRNLLKVVNALTNSCLLDDVADIFY